MTARLLRALDPWRRQHRLYWSNPAQRASVPDFFSRLTTASTLHPFSLPQPLLLPLYYPCTPDDLAYFDDTESGSRKHFSRL